MPAHLDRRRAPLFVTLNGVVMYCLDHKWHLLLPGESKTLRRHGQFEVEHVGETHAIIRNITRKCKAEIMFVPPRRGLLASNGRQKHCNVRYHCLQRHYTPELIKALRGADDRIAPSTEVVCTASPRCSYSKPPKCRKRVGRHACIRKPG